MRKMGWILRLLPIVLLISGVARANTVAYFEKIRVNDAYMIAGITALKTVEKDQDYYKFSYDLDGQINNINYFSQGKAAADPVLGVSRICIKWDGLSEYLTFFDQAGFPTPVVDYVFVVRTDFNEQGRPTACSFYDKKYAPTVNNRMVSQIKWNYTADLRQAMVSFYNEKGQRVWAVDGINQLRESYDPKGFLTESINVDDQGNPIENKEGYSAFQYLHDANGVVTELREFKTKNSFVPTGYAFSEWLYDQAGNVSQIVYSMKKSIPKDFYNPSFGYVLSAKAYNGKRLINQSKALGRS